MLVDRSLQSVKKWDFALHLKQEDVGGLTAAAVTTLQVNLGRRCNQACHHCHVEAGPKRTETMPTEVAERVMTLLEESIEVDTLDLTGGAPELNAVFRPLVKHARSVGKRVIDRCNLTILFEEGMEDLPEFLAEQGVEIVASLPCYGEKNVDKQRGRGVFNKSIEALRLLNRLGYGQAGTGLSLNLVYNPLGASLPPAQQTLERSYKTELEEGFGIQFNHLLTLTNLPIRRFARMLVRTERLDEYMSLLVNHFNPVNVPQVMCRSLVSVGWDGRLFDCDFNQMLEMPVRLGQGKSTVFDLGSLDDLHGRSISTGSHCFGCTAGAGSSCGGALQE